MGRKLLTGWISGSDKVPNEDARPLQAAGPATGPIVIDHSPTPHTPESPGWFSPKQRELYNIQHSRVPGTIFEYRAFHRDMISWRSSGTVQALYAGIAFLFFLLIITTPITHLPVIGQSAGLLVLGAIGVVGYFVYGSWVRFEKASASEDEWKKLEAIGPQWHFENGSWFPLSFRRNDGSYKVFSHLTRDKRLEMESSGVSSRLRDRANYEKKLWVAAAKAAGVTFGLYVICGFFNWTLPLAWNVPLIAGLWVATTTMPSDFGALQRVTAHQADYERDYHFIEGARVRDELHQPLTRETVEAQKSMGDASYVSPSQAAQQLRS